MDWSTISGMIARHALTALAGTLVTHGLMASDPSTTEAFVGIGMGVGGGIWSWWKNKGHAELMAKLEKAKS